MILKISYLFDAFEKGLNEKYIETRPPINHHLKNYCRQFIHTHATSDELKQFDETVRIRDSILKNAQNGWVSKSEIEFAKLTSSYSAYQWNEPILLLMESQDWPLQAFIEYQKKDMSKANIALEKGIQADWLLENRYFFKEMLYHRIHLIHNQAKVFLKENKPKDAIKTMLKIMTQIADPSQNYFTPPITIEENMVSQEYITLLFHHLCDSLALINREFPEIFMATTAAEVRLDNTKNIYTETLENIYAITQNKDIQNPAIEKILMSGNLQYAGFWYSVVAIFHKWCEENETHFANEIIRKLIEKKAPAVWLQFVKSSH